MPWRSPPDRLLIVEFDGDADAAEADHVDQDLLSDLLLLLDVDEAEAVGDLAADEEIAPQGLLFGERLVLVDRLDRQAVRAAHREAVEIDLLVADEQAPGSWREHAGHHLDQRRFAGAVVADQADDLVPPDTEVDVLQRLHRAKILLNIRQADDVREVLRRVRPGFIYCGIHRNMLLAAIIGHDATRPSPANIGTASRAVGGAATNSSNRFGAMLAGMIPATLTRGRPPPKVAIGSCTILP